MGARRSTATWFLRVGIATAILSGIGVLADPGSALAADLLSGQGSVPAGRLIQAFATALFVTTLCIRQVHGRGCPVKTGRR